MCDSYHFANGNDAFLNVQTFEHFAIGPAYGKQHFISKVVMAALIRARRRREILRFWIAKNTFSFAKTAFQKGFA